MIILYVALGAVLVFAVAAAFVGSSAFRLGHEPPPVIFDLDEAVDFAADMLPPSVTAQLTFGELRHLIVFALDHLREKGLSALPGEELEPLEGPPVMVADDDSVAYVLGRAGEHALEVDDAHVFEVVRALLGYLADIGAVGTSLPTPLEPDDTDE